jgi:putative CocE/NonD family hydrolase
MPDGVTLLADLYRPRGAEAMPTVLVRTPYGRRGPLATVNSRLLAERGLQVLLQSCRGTFGSGGELEPFRERDDGLATLAWIREQPWHRGSVGTTGASYLGIAQWALAAEAGPDLAALVGAVTASDPHIQIYPGGGFSLELALGWSYITDVQERPLGELRRVFVRRRLRRALNAWPLAVADEKLGRNLRHYQDWLAHDNPAHPYWDGKVFESGVPDVQAPVDLVTGWHDLFLPGQLSDFRRLRDAGRDVHLTVGPWPHVAPGLVAEHTRRAIQVLQRHLVGGSEPEERARVSLYVGGAREWRDLPDWPPPDAQEQPWYLQPGFGLARAAPSPSHPDTYIYDPGNPTPAVGGPVLFGRARRNNRRLEARPDVLTYTSAPISKPLDVVGPVSAEVHLASDRQHTDVFVRLCDVDTRGVSRNVCDGFQRLSADDHSADAAGPRRVLIDMWPTAHRFAAGHRLRVQVSSGAHPRFARHPGTGQSLQEHSPLLAARQRVFHDPQHPSAVFLPVVDATTKGRE